MESILRKVKPALYKLKGTRWHWVFLSELANVLGWNPQRVFETYRDLASVIWAGRGGWAISPLHWATKEGPCCTKENPHHEEPSDFKYLLVPAGWSERVLTVFSYGIIRLERRICSSRSTACDGTIQKFFLRSDECSDEGDSMAIIGYASVNCDAYIGHFGLRVDPPLFKDTLSVENKGLPF